MANFSGVQGVSYDTDKMRANGEKLGDVGADLRARADMAGLHDHCQQVQSSLQSQVGAASLATEIARYGDLMDKIARGVGNSVSVLGHNIVTLADRVDADDAEAEAQLDKFRVVSSAPW